MQLTDLRSLLFVPATSDAMLQKAAERGADAIILDLEDAVPAHRKTEARAGAARAVAALAGRVPLMVRVNASPDMLRADLAALPLDRLQAVMLPKVEGPWDIHYLDQLLAQLEARHNVTRPILIHAILETAEGVKNVEAIAAASPRMHGISLGPADLAASRAMKTTRVGGGHPDYVVLEDAAADVAADRRVRHQQDLWHYTIAKMVDACAAAGIKSFYGPFGDFSDPAACEAQFCNSFLLGCAGVTAGFRPSEWSRAPPSSTSTRRSPRRTASPPVISRTARSGRAALPARMTLRSRRSATSAANSAPSPAT